MKATIRRIHHNEGLRLRLLRLAALADAPMAFRSTLEREEAFPEHVWHERAERGAVGANRVTFVAEHDGEGSGLQRVWPMTPTIQTIRDQFSLECLSLRLSEGMVSAARFWRPSSLGHATVELLPCASG